MSNTRKDHWAAVKWLLQYLKGISNLCLRFENVGKPELEGFMDSDMSFDADTSRSTSEICYMYARGAVSLQSRLQKTIALSTMEPEYMAIMEVSKEVILQEVSDSQSVIGELEIRQEEY